MTSSVTGSDGTFIRLASTASPAVTGGGFILTNGANGPWTMFPSTTEELQRQIAELHEAVQQFKKKQHLERENDMASTPTLPCLGDVWPWTEEVNAVYGAGTHTKGFEEHREYGRIFCWNWSWRTEFTMLTVKISLIEDRLWEVYIEDSEHMLPTNRWKRINQPPTSEELYNLLSTLGALKLPVSTPA